jgi:hypothetical protein
MEQQRFCKKIYHSLKKQGVAIPLLDKNFILFYRINQ